MTERQIELDVEAFIDDEYRKLYGQWKAGLIDDREYRRLGYAVDVEGNKRYAEAMANATLVDA